MSGPRSYVRVALPLPLDQSFTYAVEGDPLPSGTRVLVPFQRQERIGFVVGQGGEEEVKRVRTVLSVMDAEPSVTEAQMRLARWMADYYVTSLGITLKTMLPSVLSETSRDVVTLLDGPRGKLSPREARLVEALASGTPHSVRALKRGLGMGSIWPELRSLASAGVVALETLPPRPPPVLTERVVRVKRWIEDIDELSGLLGRARRQADAYRALAGSGGTVELSHLTRQAGFSRSVIRGLEEKGLALVEDREVERDPFVDTPTGEDEAHIPTRSQGEIIRTLASAFDAGPSKPFLLHGVTGSGKTLVYIELLSHVLSQGRGAIVLVPEISLTPQTVARFRARFGDQVAVLHSALSEGERFDAWRQIRSGDRRIAVGARSALFAPVFDLGAIIVDEEHDGSYKQSEAPRYQARDMAVVRSAQEGALCLLGSATPALESWHNAERGKFQLVSLPERVGGGTLPPVRLIDLRLERQRERQREPQGERQEKFHGERQEELHGEHQEELHGERREELHGERQGELHEERQGDGREERTKSNEESRARSEAGLVLTPPLVEAMRGRLQRDEQTILLLNRRGYSSFVQCRECGDVETCPACSVSLTYHRGRRRLLCHHCRHDQPAPRRCRRCGSTDLSFRGLGTEQVERVVVETFPEARLARMDVDTTSGKWSHHEILGRVERGEIDVLLGTQMIAKGLDFPRVTLVGVVNADVGMHLPDFRATERTFQLLSQVAGRAGRGALGGDVLIQTALPEHYAIQAATTHDYVAFAKRELSERERPAYPPTVRLINVVLSSPVPEDAAANAEAAAGWLRTHVVTGSPVDLTGPAPSPIERLHGRWRWHFLLRSVSVKALGAAARRLQSEFRTRGTDVRVAIDRDPNALL